MRNAILAGIVLASILAIYSIVSYDNVGKEARTKVKITRVVYEETWDTGTMRVYVTNTGQESYMVRVEMYERELEMYVRSRVETLGPSETKRFDFSEIDPFLDPKSARVSSGYPTNPDIERSRLFSIASAVISLVIFGACFILMVYSDIQKSTMEERKRKAGLKACRSMTFPTAFLIKLTFKDGFFRPSHERDTL